MTTIEEDLHDFRPGQQKVALALAVIACVPGVVLRVVEPHWPHPLEAFVFGLAIVGAAFMLSWAAEVAQLDISAGLAIAVLAFIAVLPEYAVDAVLAFKGGNAFEEFGRVCQSAAEARAGQTPSCSLALANMTGANRLLIGVGWPMVVFLAWLKMRRRGQPFGGIDLNRGHSVELAFLALATAYSLTLPLRRTISLVDTAVLVAIFAAYTWRISRAPSEEPHLVGPARWIGSFSVSSRRGSVVGLFLVAATVILLCAEHFAEALVETGVEYGVSEFLLLQWLAPLASEAPELLVAGLYAWRLNTGNALGTLVSSKVNQWTMLVGTLPVMFAIAAGGSHGLPIIAEQRGELLLTAAQSVFAVAILMNLTFSTKEALTVFVLFWAQFVVGAVVGGGSERVIVSVLYLLGGLYVLVRGRAQVGRTMRDGFRTPWSELEPE